MTRRNFGGFLALLGPVLSLVGCGTSQIIQSLQLVIDAATVAIPLVAAAAGLPASTVNLLLNYLGMVSQAVDGSVLILNGSGTSAEKAARIAALFAKIAAPSLTGLPAAIVSALQLVAQRIAEFLANLPTNQGGVMASKPLPVFTSKDLQKLSAIQNQAQADIAAAMQAHRP